MPRSSKRQTRLTFDPLPTSSPVPSDMSKSVRDRAATVRFEGANPAKRRKVRDALQDSSLAAAITASIPEESLPPTPDATGLTNSFGASVVSDDEIRPTPRLSSRKTQSRLSQKKQQKLDLTPSSPRAINNSRPVRAGFFGTQQQLDADSSDESDSLPKLPIKSQKKKSKHQRKHKSQSPEVDEEKEQEVAQPTVISDDDDSEDDLPITPAVNRKRKRQAGSSSPSALIPDDEEDEDSDVVVTGSRKRLSPTKKQAPPQPESDSDDEPPSSRSRKRLRRVKDSAPMSTITEEEKQELEDDLVDLASSGSDTEVRVSQRNKSSQKNARQLALERLKARRKAPMSSIVEDEDDEEEEEEEDQVNDEEDYHQSSDEEEEEDYDEPPEPSTHRTTRKQMFAEDEDDEGFVIDDDGPLGVPTNVPIAFTRYASMKAKDLFRFAIDWMVQKKINPAFQMDDEIYDLTFKKLDDEVKGLAGSKFQSAAWTSKFTLALQARPDLLSARLDRQSSAHYGRDKCDACNRSGHPATYEIKFEGKPYDKNSLEPVAPRKEKNDDSDEDDDDDSSSESSVDENAPVNYDSQGRKILPEETVFYLGKFCMSNAETAHSLQHWRYHLYEWVVEYLESAGWNTPKLIVKRDKWSVRKRRKHANKIVDIMEEQGKIKALYSDFKKEIDTARNAKQGRWDSSP
ncbi:hypothetical protein QM012_007743 [Aureobasidium pullulans]|uniref:DUF4211 domain-containing protein n=1 Tax=Aureobasidium pullulans TaxID=5580 RepID=A0ABR0TKM9_AURPU